jgi:predicted nucleic-acid-binding protein
VIGLDTNVLVRYLTQDEPKQAKVATRLIEETLSPSLPGFVSQISLVELVWVLESGYRCDRQEVASILERLLRSKSLVIERGDIVWQALRTFAAGSADIADCMIERIGHENECETTVTFDRAASRSTGMRLLAG